MFNEDQLYFYDFYLIDLDNTIFEEFQYLEKVYKEISLFFASSSRVDPELIYCYLCNYFKINGRKEIFNHLIINFGLPNESLHVCLEILRTIDIREKLMIFPQMEIILSNLINLGKPVFVTTNGNVTQQRNKVRSIEWKDMYRYLDFVFCNETQPKPSIRSFETSIKPQVKESDKGLMIGDSRVDFLFAKNIGIDFYQVTLI